MLAVVAHDLRNPLNVVMMTTQLFATQSRHGTSAISCSGHSPGGSEDERLIEDLLEVVRQENGVKLNVEEVSAASLLAQAAEMFQPPPRERHLLRVEECPPAWR